MVQPNQGGGLLGAVSFKPLIYGYSNARVRAMRRFLLTRRGAEDMLKMNTNAAVAEYLSRTAYRESFANMPLKVTDEERVELAIQRNFAATAQKLLRVAPAITRPTLEAFLGRYDIHNIQTILLARKLGKAPEETERLLIPAGNISRQEIARLIGAKSADEFYAVLRSTAFGAKFFASASIRKIPRAQIKAIFQPGADEEKLELFLSALDFYYYESASSVILSSDKDASAILDILRSEADAKNVMTSMRLRRGGADKKVIMEHMVGGGRMSRSQLEKLAAAKDVHEQVSIASSFFISQTGKAEFGEAEKLYKSDGQLSHFEVVFERSIARRSLHALRRSIMSIGALIGFLFLKEQEVSNITKIVRAKALGIAPEKAAEMLVLV
jgi:V/A-type H+-transporting ATPase subunit C